MKKYTIITGSISLFLLLLTAFLIWWEPRWDFLHLPRIIIGSLAVLGLPGYWITRWTFPQDGSEKILDETRETLSPEEVEETGISTIDWLERFVLSVALSISSVPLLLFYVNFLWVPLTIWSVYGTIAIVTVASMIGTIFVEKKHEKK